MRQVTSWVGWVLATAVVAAGCSGGDEPDQKEPASGGADATATASAGVTGTATGTPSGTTAATPGAPQVQRKGVPAARASAATDAVGKALTSLNDALATPAEAPSILDDAVVGAAREALLAQAAEYEENGWAVTGEPTILRTVVRGKGSRVRVRACVDQSAVVVTDSAGNRLPTGTGAPRTWLIFTLEQAPSGWQVVEQTFPADPDC
ncbi:hypothetical protein QI633_12575 [Nocardioides sp. QY071]|uniref:hypothetical protein n=1 Tax=Nocardioides sp. QY071 TaxID=3044187 RepID=UPI00249ACD16|nr:hypothetical protein [Nocardioides sp. QY071]WGY04576.1 hypothetical protein QI633_12575 [Nocardioides sp. QY071]